MPSVSGQSLKQSLIQDAFDKRAAVRVDLVHVVNHTHPETTVLVQLADDDRSDVEALDHSSADQMPTFAGVHGDNVIAIYVTVWQPTCKEYVQFLLEIIERFVNVLTNTQLEQGLIVR